SRKASWYEGRTKHLSNIMCSVVRQSQKGDRAIRCVGCSDEPPRKKSETDRKNRAAVATGQDTVGSVTKDTTCPHQPVTRFAERSYRVTRSVTNIFTCVCLRVDGLWIVDLFITFTSYVCHHSRVTTFSSLFRVIVLNIITSSDKKRDNIHARPGR